MSPILATAILSGVASLASLGVGIASFAKLKIHRDNTRQGIKWVPWSLIVNFLGALLVFAQTMYYLVAFRYIPSIPAILGSLGRFLITLSIIGLFIALLETSFGILIMWSSAPRRIRVMRLTMWAIASLLLLLTLVIVVGLQVVTSGRIGASYWGIFNILALTREALIFVALSWVMGMSIIVFKRARALRLDGGLYSGNSILSLFYAAVAVAWFGSVWFLVQVIVFLVITRSDYYQIPTPVIIVLMIYEIIHFVTPFVSLTLLFLLGLRMEGGLWASSIHNQGPQAGGQHDYVTV